MAEVTVTAQRREETLSKVPVSVTALTQADIDNKGIKDISDVARFTPGINVDNAGTNNISIRGIASSGGAGTTGIYIDDTPIQMRALAFNPDEALPKAFDIERVEVLRGPQGTLFGAGSEGGTVRYITTQPSLTKTSIYSRERSFVHPGRRSEFRDRYRCRRSAHRWQARRARHRLVSPRRRLDRSRGPDRGRPAECGRRPQCKPRRQRDGPAGSLVGADGHWTVTPSIYYQSRQSHDVSNYWPLYSNPSDNSYVSGNPTQRAEPDKFYLPALKIQGDFGAFQLISNTSYFHR